MEESTNESPKKKRSCWIQSWRRDRHVRGNTENFLRVLGPNFLGMDEFRFQEILKKIAPRITKCDTVMRPAVTAEEKLAITLRFLATGESFRDLERNSKLSRVFLSQEIVLVCTAIFESMEAEYLKFPTKKHEWETIAKEFNERWQFPFCMGALDGMHIGFQPRAADAPLYLNYKGFHSMVLLAIAEANGRFVFIDVGCSGRISDGGVLKRSALFSLLEKPEKYFPEEKHVGNGKILPHTFVGDNAFPLMPNLMTPYPHTSTDESKVVYNRRISRAIQCVERAFNILCNRFRILKKTINLREDKVREIVKCCCVLHNFLIRSGSAYYTKTCSPLESAKDQALANSEEQTNGHSSVNDIRENWSEFFNEF